MRPAPLAPFLLVCSLLVVELLAALQWIGSVNVRGRIDEGHLWSALELGDGSAAFFSMAIMNATSVPVDATRIDAILAFLDSDDDKISGEAADLLRRDQASLAGRLIQELQEGEESTQVAILGFLDAERLGSEHEAFRALVDGFLDGRNKTLKTAAIGAAGRLAMNEREAEFIDLVDSKTYGTATALALLRLYHGRHEELLSDLGDRDSAAALQLRFLLGDDDARTQVFRKMDGGGIRDKMLALQIVHLSDDALYFDSYSRLTSYENSDFAPTDYFVAAMAQTATLNYLTNHPGHRNEH